MKRRGAAWPSVLVVLGLVSCPALVHWTLPEPAAARGPSGVRDVERLIEDLGSKDFDVREAATRALKELDEAPPTLRRALGASDLEVRRRAAEIVEGIEQRRAMRGLRRAQALAKEGRIVEAVERVVFFARQDSEGAGGQALTGFAAAILEQLPAKYLRYGVLASGQRQKLPAGDFRTYVDSARPHEIVGGKLSYGQRDAERFGCFVFARGEEVSFEHNPNCLWSLVATSGEFRCRPPVRESVIIAGGNVKIGDALGAIIVCDGDVEVTEGATGCLIVARGKVTSPSPLRTDVVRSRDFVSNPFAEKEVGTKVTPDPLAFVKFFELFDVGLTVAEPDGQGEAVQDGVCLKEVRKGTMFSPVLQAGDVVTAIDGTKTASQEVLRKLLRKQLARGGPRITLSVRRAGKTSDIAVPVKD
jgi:hypothetical protein